MSSLETSRTSLSASESDDLDDSLIHQFKDFQLLSKEEIIEAIENCKKTITESEDSSEKKLLVRRLVDLRYRLTHEMAGDEKPSEINVSGHTFKIMKHSKRTFCDFCSNCIWIFQVCRCH
jgi:hypothetical protein